MTTNPYRDLMQRFSEQYATGKNLFYPPMRNDLVIVQAWLQETLASLSDLPNLMNGFERTITWLDLDFDEDKLAAWNMITSELALHAAEQVWIELTDRMAELEVKHRAGLDAYYDQITKSVIAATSHD